jgi:hypothetical protein
MIQEKLALINEHTSPLFRIMWVYNEFDNLRRSFENNICAFHIGNGYVLSVAHNLRVEAGVVKSIDESIFLTEIMPFVQAPLQDFFNQHFVLDSNSQKRYLIAQNPNEIQQIVNELKRIQFDTRWITMKEKKICKPYLLLQYRDPFLANLTVNIPSFFENHVQRYTYLVELELTKAFYSDDIALYKIVNMPQSFLDRLPSVEPDFTILDNDTKDYFCLQSAPVDNLGRLLNDAKIEGILDHWNIFPDNIGGNYLTDGLRYLIKGYFRFGSSGAPYLMYERESGKFKVNAVQSEASPIQLSINNNKNGNFQYINAVASPLYNIKSYLDGLKLV